MDDDYDGDAPDTGGDGDGSDDQDAAAHIMRGGYLKGQRQ